jgi:hypothetical protein
MMIISVYFTQKTGKSARDELAADCLHSQNKALYKQGNRKKAAIAAFFLLSSQHPDREVFLHKPVRCRGNLRLTRLQVD